jgi:hypothetical protein
MLLCYPAGFSEQVGGQESLSAEYVTGAHAYSNASQILSLDHYAPMHVFTGTSLVSCCTNMPAHLHELDDLEGPLSPTKPHTRTE